MLIVIELLVLGVVRSVENIGGRLMLVVEASNVNGKSDFVLCLSVSIIE